MNKKAHVFSSDHKDLARAARSMSEGDMGRKGGAFEGLSRQCPDGNPSSGKSDKSLNVTPTSEVIKREGRYEPIAPEGYIRLSGPLEHDNIVNGYGLRAVLWTQGCARRCPGCQNPETWDFREGVLIKIDEIKEKLKAFPGQAGITFCGGEPFAQPEACKEIADWCRQELGWNVWSFSGYTYEELKEIGDAKWEFVKSLDALIDGPFVLAERDLTLKFRGSKNQRLLHLQHGTGKILRIE